MLNPEPSLAQRSTATGTSPTNLTPANEANRRFAHLEESLGQGTVGYGMHRSLYGGNPAAYSRAGKYVEAQITNERTRVFIHVQRSVSGGL
jgi:hypothetical protein